MDFNFSKFRLKYIALSKEIRKYDSSVGNTRWLLPLKKDDYSEIKIDKVDELKTADLSFGQIMDHGGMLLI